MGDDIQFKEAEVINGGSDLQVDLWNNTKNHGIRFFCKPEDILKALSRHFTKGRRQFEKELSKQHGKDLC